MLDVTAHERGSYCLRMAAIVQKSPLRSQKGTYLQGVPTEKSYFRDCLGRNVVL